MKKLLNKKGFTLMEMLIVVAIIVILVAISVPTFTSQLNKAKAAADEANFRAAKATATSAYLTDDLAFDASGNAEFIYDAENGKLAQEVTIGYGKSTEDITGITGKPDGNVIKMTINNGGTIKYEWVATSTKTTTALPQ